MVFLYFVFKKILLNFAKQISEEKFGLIATSIKNAKTDNFFLVRGIPFISLFYMFNDKKELYALSFYL